MLQFTGAAACDDGEARRVRDAAREREVVAGQHAVGRLARRQDAPDAEIRHLPCERNGVLAGRGAAAVDVDLALRGKGVVRVGVDRDDDPLRPEARHRLADHLRIPVGGARDGHRARPGLQGADHVIAGADSAAQRQGDGDGRRDPLDEIEDGLPVLDGRRNVEERDLVRAAVRVGLGGLDGVRGVAELHEVDALHHPPLTDVEAWDDADGFHGHSPLRDAAPRARSVGYGTGGSLETREGPPEWDHGAAVGTGTHGGRMGTRVLRNVSTWANGRAALLDRPLTARGRRSRGLNRIVAIPGRRIGRDPSRKRGRHGAPTT